MSEPSSQDDPPKNAYTAPPGIKAVRAFTRAVEQGMTEMVINDRCKCSHDRFRHNYDTADGPCSKPDCDCKAYAPVTVETVELPEPGCTQACTEAHTYSGSCMLRSAGPVPCQHNWHSPEDCPWVPSEGPNEAPLESHECDNCEGVDPDSCLTRLPPPEGPEYMPCVCEHIESHHRFAARSCYKCSCPEYRPDRPESSPCDSCGSDDSWFDRSVCAEPCSSMHDRCTNCGAVSGHCPLETPPQPERRPPLTVQYSVAGGHPYEVSIPGDASVTAEDGVLIVKHPSAQILAITRVAPMEES